MSIIVVVHFFFFSFAALGGYLFFFVVVDFIDFYCAASVQSKNSIKGKISIKRERNPASQAEKRGTIRFIGSRGSLPPRPVDRPSRQLREEDTQASPKYQVPHHHSLSLTHL